MLRGSQACSALQRFALRSGLRPPLHSARPQQRQPAAAQKPCKQGKSFGTKFSPFFKLLAIFGVSYWSAK
ncbi:hypothetical protein SGRA_1052 [Saprospira grandis str. Lewin]|uniref:Uncharacterized protein n=1 Tax=Saprospira grandis (strain Lewin) TaxID=984262 RepID=H6L3E0_SAPGL|nr:hypothetical protein SGRA_1052 [Saprospira grandis str. Lewin]